MLEEQSENMDTRRRVLVLWHECDGETEAGAIERTKREQGLTDEEFARAAVGTVGFVAAATNGGEPTESETGGSASS